MPLPGSGVLPDEDLLPGFAGTFAATLPGTSLLPGPTLLPGHWEPYVGPASPFADEYVDAFLPWLTSDLEAYLRSIGEMFVEVDELSNDTDDHEGWTRLFDPTRARTQDLPFLAMVIGERLPVGLPEPMAREWIGDAPNSYRGTLMSIVRAAQRTLTGQRLVSIKERWGASGADDDAVTVVTYSDQTPYPDQVEDDLRYLVIPGDITLNYEVLSGQDWASVESTYATWGALNTTGRSWGDVAAAQTGYATYSRPRPT